MATIQFDGFDPNDQYRTFTSPGYQSPEPVNASGPSVNQPTITSDTFPKFPTPPQSLSEWSGWNQDNVFKSWDLNPLAQTVQIPGVQLGDTRDALSRQREAYLQPFMSQYRGAVGDAASNDDDMGLFHDPAFQNFVRTGQVAQPAASVTPQSSSQLAPRQVSAPQQPQTNVGGQFTDPITSYVEAFAKQRAEQRENPPAGSGQNLLEQALRSMSGQFQQGGYTPAETEIFQTQAIEPIEKLRASRKQQVLQNLSARGISPQSGVAQQMLADVDRQMDAARIETQRTLAGNQANERTRRMMQAIEMLSGLSDQENRRLNEGYQYRTVPMQLADRSFGQAITAYNAGGNPLTLAQPLMQLSQLQSGRSNNWQQALGYLAAMLANGG